jgi:nucleoside-diphosphate-sugar epimerase
MSDKPTVAVVGANGFIGSRLVESLVFSDLAEVRALVRSFNGMVRSARFLIDCRVVDGTDASHLQPHLKGCDILFNCVTGGGDTIVKNIQAVYRASAAVGVRRLVHLSSAVVHGNNPAVGTLEETQLIADQPFEYNVKKVQAENLLWQLAGDGGVEVVVLRPLIVYGPRSALWTARIASELIQGKAYLVDKGTGICNTVFVDDLIHAMWLAAVSEQAVNQAFFITDGERVTWRDLYGGLAEVVGVDLTTVSNVNRDILQNIGARMDKSIWNSVIRQSGHIVKQLLPPAVKFLAKGIVPRSWALTLREFWESAHESGSGGYPQVSNHSYLTPVDLYVASLQDCRYILPITKAERYLGYKPQISFAAGRLKAGSWVKFAFGLK